LIYHREDWMSAFPKSRCGAESGGGVLVITTPILLQQQKGSDFSGAAIAFSTTQCSAAVDALFSWYESVSTQP
jgi:hypothetical protein